MRQVSHCPHVKLVQDFETEKGVLLAVGTSLALSPYRASTGVPPMGEASLILPPSRAGTGCRALESDPYLGRGTPHIPMVVPTVKPEKWMTCVRSGRALISPADDRLYSP